jgi:hypothetical protein
MDTGGARVSVWGRIEQEEEELGPEIVSRLLYGDGARLVTSSRKERSPAREEKRSTACCWRPCALRG